MQFYDCSHASLFFDKPLVTLCRSWGFPARKPSKIKPKIKDQKHDINIIWNLDTFLKKTVANLMPLIVFFS